MSQPLLEVRHVSKTFPGVRALDDVSLQVAGGEIVALLGHNGSGKSTLVKILAGVYSPDPGGEVHVRGDEDAGAGDHHGTRDRLHFIHQDLGLIPLLTTVENLDLSRSLGGSALLPARTRSERRHADELIREFGADFDVRLPVAELTPAERAIVAIARSLDGWTGSDNVLVLDEPTAALHDDEVVKLSEAVRQVAGRGAGVVFISQRLEDVVALADRVIVLRDGRVVANQPKGAFDHDWLVRQIAGREIERGRHRVSARQPQVRLAVRKLAGPEFDAVSFDVHAGEIVGIGGILGSGREQVAAALFGALPGAGGDVRVDGCAIPPASPAAAIRAGLGYVPADRRRHGAIVQMSARENLTLPRLSPLRRALGRLDMRAERREAGAWMSEVDVRPATPERPFALFSGGNQQKIVLAKWLRNEPLVLILDEPTQGVDVGAKAAIYGLVARAAADGAAVLVSSSDTEELTVLCNRVLVLRDGRLVADIGRASLTEATLLKEALGTGGRDVRDPSDTSAGGTPS